MMYVFLQCDDTSRWKKKKKEEDEFVFRINTSNRYKQHEVTLQLLWKATVLEKPMTTNAGSLLLLHIIDNNTLLLSIRRMPRIELNGEREPVWLTPHLRDPQPEGEREIDNNRLQ